MNFMRRTNLCFKRGAAVFLCMAGILTLTACGSVNREQRQVVAMDTVMTLTAYGKNASAGLDAAACVIHSMNGELDPELPTSTTYAINHANGSAVVVNAQTAKMLSTAKTVYDQSDGALDLSIYPVVKIWGFTNRRYYVPTYEELAMKLAQRAYDKMVLTSYPATGSYSVIFPAGTDCGQSQLCPERREDRRLLRCRLHQAAGVRADRCERQRDDPLLRIPDRLREARIRSPRL